jgi:hypothetical protein
VIAVASVVGTRQVISDGGSGSGCIAEKGGWEITTGLSRLTGVISSMGGHAAQVSLYWPFPEAGTNRVVFEVAILGVEGQDGEVNVPYHRPRVRAYHRGIFYFTGAEGPTSDAYKARSPKAVVVENACVAATISSAASAWGDRTASRLASQRPVSAANLASRRAAW